MMTADPGQATERVAVVVNGPCGWLPPRILASWLDDERAIERLRWMGEVTGLDLIHLGTVADQAQLADPGTHQPLAAALAILAGQELLASADFPKIIIAGHGVGEIPAAVLAGVLTEEDGLRLSVRLGRAQARVAAGRPETGMVALLGGYPPDIEQRARDLGLSVSAYNGAGNIVLAGERPKLHDLVRHPPAHARAEPLPARCASYCTSMSQVAAELESALAEQSFREPRCSLLSGYQGRLTSDGPAYLRWTTCQLTGPVHWDQVLNGLDEAGVSTVLELPPAGVLTGYAVRALPGLRATPIRTAPALLHARILLAAAR